MSSSVPGPSLFLERLLTFLVPYFLALTEDLDLAKAEALETLASYGARTRSEMITAAQLIAFSFSAMEMLTEAKIMEMPVALRLRYRNCASSLNRASQQNQKVLDKKLACDVPGATSPAAEPVNDTSDAEVEQRLQHAQAKIDTTRGRLSSPAPTQHAPNRRAAGSSMFNALMQALDQPPPATT